MKRAFFILLFLLSGIIASGQDYDDSTHVREVNSDFKSLKGNPLLSPECVLYLLSLSFNKDEIESEPTYYLYLVFVNKKNNQNSTQTIKIDQGRKLLIKDRTGGILELVNSHYEILDASNRTLISAKYSIQREQLEGIISSGIEKIRIEDNIGFTDISIFNWKKVSAELKQMLEEVDNKKMLPQSNLNDKIYEDF